MRHGIAVDTPPKKSPRPIANMSSNQIHNRGSAILT